MIKIPKSSKPNARKVKPEEMKKIIANFVLVSISLGFSIIILNIFFVKIFNQDSFPRSLVSQSGGKFQYTYYPKTFSYKNLDHYVAIIGDSYAQGMGDAYLSGEENYSIAHHLHNVNKGNYLIFARSGYGSTNAVKNLIDVIHFSKMSPFFRSLRDPKEIYFFSMKATI